MMILSIFNNFWKIRIFSRTFLGFKKVLADLAASDWWRYCKARYDVEFREIEGNGRKFCKIELSNSIISNIFLQCIGSSCCVFYHEGIDPADICSAVYIPYNGYMLHMYCLPYTCMYTRQLLNYCQSLTSIEFFLCM